MIPCLPLRKQAFLFGIQVLDDLGGLLGHFTDQFFILAFHHHPHQGLGARRTDEDAAIFAKAYENNGLTRLMTQALDPESQIVIAGLLKAAPKMQKLEGLPDGYDVRDLVATAAERAVNARRTGNKLQDEARQTSFLNEKDDDDAASAIVQVFADNSRSSSGIANKLSKMADFLYSEGTKESVDLFGEVQKLNRTDAVREGLARDTAKRQKMSQKAKAYWHKHGRGFLTGFFDGKADKKTFFASMRKALER